MELSTLIRLLFPVNTCHTLFEATEEITFTRCKLNSKYFMRGILVSIFGAEGLYFMKNWVSIWSPFLRFEVSND